ncbi:hypothetical protein PENSPDRAFT_691423 [Peniophora sp. CONT]|nr:hypothetical protein PENSPDRAFT_691423 [Peniophora sp. CONT]
MTVTPDEIRIVNSQGPATVWSSIKPDTIFTGHAVESKDENKIHMNLSCFVLSEIVHTFHKSGRYGDEVWIALVKHQDRASLRIERTQSGTGNMNVLHHLLVNVICTDDLPPSYEPFSVVPDVILVLPSVSDMRSIIVRLGAFADTINISADTRGRLELDVAHDDACMLVAWSNLKVKIIDDSDSQRSQLRDSIQRQEQRTASVTVRCKALAKVMAAAEALTHAAFVIFDEQLLCLIPTFEPGGSPKDFACILPHVLD